MKHSDIVIIGGGAAGLMAAYSAAKISKAQKQNLHITVLEGNDRLGKKLLATGNGRCNLTNDQISKRMYLGDDVSTILEQAPTSKVIRIFNEIGLLCNKDAEGRVYPRNAQAAAVLKLFMLSCDTLNVSFEYGFNAISVSPSKTGYWIKAEDGSERAANAVILASGGKASPNHSCSVDNGYAIMKRLGHTVTPCHPALAPLMTTSKLIKTLKGIRAKARLSLFDKEKQIHEETGEIIFSDRAISGIAAFNLSAYLVNLNLSSAKERISVVVDFAAEIEHLSLVDHLRAICKNWSSRKISELLAGVVSIKLGEALIASLGYDRLSPLSKLSLHDIARIASAVKSYRFPIHGVAGFHQAQITAGGLSLAEFDLLRMESKKFPRIFAAGEILNAHGLCGGYNLHLAWVTGYLAGKNAAKQLTTRPS